MAMDGRRMKNVRTTAIVLVLIYVVLREREGEKASVGVRLIAVSLFGLEEKFQRVSDGCSDCRRAVLSLLEGLFELRLYRTFTSPYSSNISILVPRNTANNDVEFSGYTIQVIDVTPVICLSFSVSLYWIYC